MSSQFFGDKPYIRKTFEWISLERCVWNGPDFLLGTTVLESCYPGDNYLKGFFTTILAVKDATFKTVIDELIACSRANSVLFTPAAALKMYTYLDTHVQNEADWVEIR